MDSTISSLYNSNNAAGLFSTSYNAKTAADYNAVQTLLGTSDDAVDCSFSDLGKCYTVEASEIIKALNAKLADKVSGGIESLDPEEHTAEKTAERIVNSITGLFAAYQKSNSNVDPEEMLTNFMNAVRSGVQTGYDDAFEILDGLGAFQFDGVQSGIEKTLELIHNKLDDFEASMKVKLGIAEKNETADTVKNEVLTQAGSILSSISLDA